MFEGFEPDLSRACTPPAAAYLDAECYRRERERVFARTWQPVARTAELAEHGAFVCAELAGHPVVLVRDRDELRGFHNVCRHRAGPVATGAGCRKSLQCRYHGWTYRLDGRLIAAPEMDGVQDFDPASIHLAPIAVDTRGPLLFAALDPAPT
ncbi:MAG TPA: Rieske (2Fe-2S) protein, partial [Kofleriaceae bacterium]|nr:Rieske (2Fe-2S) protein [Kofleriaceae bacterium]